MQAYHALKLRLGSTPSAILTSGSFIHFSIQATSL